jgi:hypothetical protein
MTVLKILWTLAGGPLNLEALGFSLSSLYVNLELYASNTAHGGTLYNYTCWYVVF